jgi:hypothetical protein
MSVRPFLLRDIKKSAVVQHQLSTGIGSYNRWSPLVPRERAVSVGKRRLSDNCNDISSQESIPKTPRFDASADMGQLKGQDTLLTEIKANLGKVDYATVIGQVLPQPVKDVIVNLGNALNQLLKSQENLTSALIDVVKVSEDSAKSQPKVSEAHKPKGKTVAAPLLRTPKWWRKKRLNRPSGKWKKNASLQPRHG